MRAPRNILLSDGQAKLARSMTLRHPTLFIWIDSNVVNADSAVGLNTFYKTCDFGLNTLILNNNQPDSFFLVWDIIWIGIIFPFIFIFQKN